MREVLAQRARRRIEPVIGSGSRTEQELGDSLFFLFALITRKGLELLLGFTTSLAGGCHGEELGRWKYRGRIIVREDRSRGRGIYRRKERERKSVAPS
jgi:hypothetical protein